MIVCLSSLADIDKPPCNYLVRNVILDANRNAIQETSLVGVQRFQMVKTLEQDGGAAV